MVHALNLLFSQVNLVDYFLDKCFCGGFVLKTHFESVIGYQPYTVDIDSSKSVGCLALQLVGTESMTVVVAGRDLPKQGKRGFQQDGPEKQEVYETD